jgi:hypothetical protein
VVPIADLRAGEIRKVVVRVRVTASAGAAMDVAEVKLAFRPRDAHQRQIAATQARVAITDDAGVVAERLDKDAVKQVEQARTARALELATDAYQRGEDQAARQILTDRQREAEEASAAVNDPSIAQQIRHVTAHSQAGFAAPPSADTGRRAAKSIRLDAYELAR